MASASGRGSRFGRTLALLAVAALPGGWLVGVRGHAQAEDPRQPTPAVTAVKKAAAGPAATGDAEVVHLINDRIAEQWAAHGLTPSARASDYDFIRRASLDIIGRIAKAEEIRQFLKDPAETRRALLIERLLKGDEYARNWANIWTVWLMTRSGALDRTRGIYHEQMHAWLQEQFAKDRSFKDLVTELLTATGKTNENGAVNYVLAHLGEPIPPPKQRTDGQFEMVPVTSRTTRLFLGLQTQCTQCHDHPFNPEWKQQQFWGVNAFFRQVQRKGQLARNREAVLELVDNPDFNPDGIVDFERRNGVVLSTRPVFLDGSRPEKGSQTPRRQELALLLTRSEYFPKAFVNRMWHHFFGRGFTNPVDDFGEHNPVTHPELLNELAKRFAEYGYQPKQLIRWLCNSEAYQLSCTANKANAKPDTEPYFSRMLLKAMSPEQLFESLIVATQAEVFESKENRKKLREDWIRNLIVNFGDDEGNEVTFNGTVVQALMMMNGKQINDIISSKQKGTVAITLAKRGASQAALHDLYMAALNRPPTSTESAKIMKILGSAPVKNRDPVGPWQDVFWALLNCNEFILNH
jgi:hypothetical protein